MFPVILVAALSAGPVLIEDDFPHALAEAKKSGKLLFVDAWAPWCHSCIFMRQHVLNQPELLPLAADLVFSAVDTEKAKNAPFLEKYPVDVWPTLFIIDPTSEAIALKWAGSADGPQLKAMIDGARGKVPASTREADQAFASGSADAAERALSSLKADASPRVLLSTLAVLSMAERPLDCARTAVERLPSVKSPEDRAGVAGWGLGCALALKADSKERAAWVPALVKETKEGARHAQVLGDDRSGLYDLLVQEREAAGDGRAATALALEWLGFLEGAAQRAPTPAARAVFDPHRVGAALAAHAPVRALGALKASEQDFPLDYNPPVRLALIYLELGRLGDALASVDKALGLCTEGPRKLRLFSTKARVLKELKDVKAQRAVLEEAVAYAKALPPGQRSEQRIAMVQAELDAASAPAR